VWSRLIASDLFFVAGAITFNVLVAVVPILLLALGIGSFVAAARFGDTPRELLGVVLSYLPALEGDADVVGPLGGLLQEIVSERAGFSLLGAIVLLWISTRLVSCLRISLSQVFDLKRRRGILASKVFDLAVVFVGGALILLNVGVTIGATALEARGIVLLGLGGSAAAMVQSLTTQMVSISSAWVLFLLVYWRVPEGRIPFRTAAVGASFTAVVYELMKGGFAWFATSVADYSSVYGSLAVVAILFFWIYYSAVVFIFGGQVAQVYEIRRRRSS
jgi:membrane protein